MGSWQEFVEDTAGEMDILDMLPEHLQYYFDYGKWARDPAMGYTIEDALGGGFFVCRDV